MKRFLLAFSCLLVFGLSAQAQTLYGTTPAGGNDGGGTINKYVPATNTLTVAKSFESLAANPYYTKFIQAGNGLLYGMTAYGGSTGNGVIFSFNPSSSVYTKLKNFDKVNGANPYGSLIQAGNGKLYGMTSLGGNKNFGVIFSFDPVSSSFAKLKDFDSTNGSNPYGSLMQASNGKLYGITYGGGTKNAGVIFSFDPVSSVYTKLKDLTYTNGGYPYGNLVQAGNGVLYGITTYGGNNGNGVIFSFNLSTSTYTKLKDFTSTSGGNPYGSLMQASDGKLYGVTSSGGSSGWGVVFSFNPASLLYTKVKDLDYANGGNPQGSLMQASDGKLYGTTIYGGTNDLGTIFSVNPVNSTYAKVKDLDKANGATPNGTLMQASDGKLYGMTFQGGSSGAGTIFSLTLSPVAYTMLKDFATNESGSKISATLLRAADGKLYGTTSSGGNKGVGIIFSFDPSSSGYTKLVDFDNDKGAAPNCALVQASDGSLYGTTTRGGSNDAGVIFSFDPVAFTYTKLKDLDNTSGANPNGSLIQASDGKMYGMCDFGGDNKAGVIFSFDPVSSTYTKLKDFETSGGSHPKGSLLQAGNGKLYGTTSSGGSNNAGVIFSFDISSLVYTKLKDLGSSTGSNPYGSLIQANNGKLYGTTNGRENKEYGAIFSFDPVSSTYTKLVNFNNTNGAFPYGSLLQAGDGKFYGMTSGGGGKGNGVVFSYDLSSLAYSKLKDFDGVNGGIPFSSFIEAGACISDTTYFRDADGDGYGSATDSTKACFKPVGYVVDNTDCNDNVLDGGAAIHPGALEVCNGIDDDCDGQTDAWTLEAETALLNGATVLTEQPGYTGSGYADFQSAAGYYIEWTVTAPSNGLFSLQFRYANGGTTDRPLKLQVNGEAATATLAFTTTGSWSTWSITSTTINLNAGLNKIRLTTIGTHGPNIDHLKVVINGCPSGPLEAELALLHGAVVASNAPGYTGTGFGDYVNTSGDYIEWTYDAAVTNLYGLKFRYSNGGTAKRNLKLEVNGVTVDANLAFAPTGGWSNWSTSGSTAGLKAGINKIRLTSTGTNGPNLDNLQITVAACQGGTAEAEQAGLNGAAVVNNQPGYTGSGFADFQSGAGHYIEWTVGIANTGQFSLQFRYANGGTTDRPLKLEINGVVVNANLPFAPTGSWATWGISQARGTLVFGTNKIRLTTVGNQNPNVDNLVFSCFFNQLPQGIVLASKKGLSNSTGTLNAFVVPNPIRANKAMLQLSTASYLPVDIKLLDMSGRSYKALKLVLKGSNTVDLPVDLPVDELLPGTYIIQLKQGNVSARTRFVKLYK